MKSRIVNVEPAENGEVIMTFLQGYDSTLTSVRLDDESLHRLYLALEATRFPRSPIAMSLNSRDELELTFCVHTSPEGRHRKCNHKKPINLCLIEHKIGSYELTLHHQSGAHYFKYYITPEEFVRLNTCMGSDFLTAVRWKKVFVQTSSRNRLFFTAVIPTFSVSKEI